MSRRPAFNGIIFCAPWATVCGLSYPHDSPCFFPYPVFFLTFILVFGTPNQRVLPHQEWSHYLCSLLRRGVSVLSHLADVPTDTTIDLDSWDGIALAGAMRNTKAAEIPWWQLAPMNRFVSLVFRALEVRKEGQYGTATPSRVSRPARILPRAAATVLSGGCREECCHHVGTCS